MTITKIKTPAAIALLGLAAYNIIAALEPATLALLHAYGENHKFEGHNPVTYCNVLFISNLVFVLSILALYGKDITIANIQKITKRQWLLLLGIVINSNILSQIFYFLSIKYTDIANTVLIAALQLPLSALLSAFLFRESLIKRRIFGHALIFASTILPFLIMHHAEDHHILSLGIVVAFAAMLTQVITFFISKELSALPLGIIGSFTGGAGGIIFFTIAIGYYGTYHFHDLILPNLWEVVALYSVFLVLGRRILKYASFKRNSRQNIVAMSASYPLVAAAAGVFINGQIPLPAQLGGLAGVTAGMLLAMDWRDASRRSAYAQERESAQFRVPCNP